MFILNLFSSHVVKSGLKCSVILYCIQSFDVLIIMNMPGIFCALNLAFFYIIRIAFVFIEGNSGQSSYIMWLAVLMILWDISYGIRISVMCL